jgi:hypothetical protein
MKFLESMSDGSCNDTCRQTDEWTDMTKLIGTVPDHAKGPTTACLLCFQSYVIMYLYFEQQTDNSYKAIQFVSIVDVTHLTSPESINVLTM